MRNRIHRILLLLLLSTAWVAPAVAAEQTAIGVRAGGWTTDNRLDFEQYELFLERGLPWRWQWSGGWTLGTKLEASVGTLHAASTTATLITLGPTLLLRDAASPFSYEAGIDLGWLSKQRFGREDMGCALQFVSHLGLNFEFSRHMDAGYRFEHISNGGTNESNPGLNLHTLLLRYRF